MALLLMLLLSGMPSPRAPAPGVVRGTVVSDEGVPLPGVTVRVCHPDLAIGSFGTASDRLGRYSLLLPSGRGYKIWADLAGHSRTGGRIFALAEPGATLDLRLIPDYETAAIVYLGCGTARSVDDSIACAIISRKRTYSAGDVPDVQVRLQNLRKETIRLVRSVDGSRERVRYPHSHFSVIGPPGGFEDHANSRCGPGIELQPRDIVDVAPMEFFDPYGFVPPLQGTHLAMPGTYRVRFTYCTRALGVHSWEPASTESWAIVRQRIGGVPRIDVSCEVILEVRE